MLPNPSLEYWNIGNSGKNLNSCCRVPAACQEVLAANVGTKDPDMLADDFEFAGPVVGPINKEQYLKAVEAALDNIYDAFPELKAQYYDFRVDPFEPNRVWYTSRGYGQMTGSFAGGAIKPNGRFIQQPPQTGELQRHGD